MAEETAVRYRDRRLSIAALIAFTVLVLAASAGFNDPSAPDGYRLSGRPGDAQGGDESAWLSATPQGPETVDLVAVAYAEAEDSPLTLDDVLAAAARAWPEQPRKAAAVTFCELGGWLNPKAFDLTQRFGGPMQIDRPTWELYFLTAHGWTWELVALDLDVHFLAAREIYDRAGGWSPWPVCGLS